KHRQFALAKEYVDEGQSGGKTSRPALNEMLLDARRGQFQILLVWKLDRLGRSTSHLISLLEDFKTWNVQLVSFSEGLDFTTTAGKLFYTLLGAFAEFERDTIRERVRAGLRNAKAKGIRLGRPKADVSVLDIRRLRANGASWRAVGRQLGCSSATALKVFR